MKSWSARCDPLGTLGVGTPTLTEAGMVLSARLGVEPQALLDRFLRDFGVMPVVFGEQHWREALDAFRRFGKGRHPASGWSQFRDKP